MTAALLVAVTWLVVCAALAVGYGLRLRRTVRKVTAARAWLAAREEAADADH